MKSKDAMVRELLASDREDVEVSVPILFHHRLIVAGRRKFGTIAKPELIKKALAQAAALGLLAWEKELNGGGKARRSRKRPATPARA